VFKMTPQQRADRDALKAAQVDPASPSYHQWLTPAEYAARFGANPSDIARVTGWLTSQGLEVHSTSPLGARVTFGGSVANLESAFRTPMRQYEVAGKLHYANSVPPQVPADLGGVVLDVTHLHDVHPRPLNHHRPSAPQYTSMGLPGFAPPDWSNVYDVAPAYTTGVNGTPITGSGVKITVVGTAEIDQSDINAWRTQFDLPAATVTQTLVPDTGPAAAGQDGAGFEAFLDVEWSGGIGQQANVNYVYIGSEDQDVDDATYYIIENNLGDIISESYGSCDGLYIAPLPNGYGYEASDQNIIDTFGSAANLLGITYVAATGDDGATGCLEFGLNGIYPGVPAAFPGVTGVGGTQFPTSAFTTGGNGYFTAYSTTEAVWNELNDGIGTMANPASGNGGISVVFSRPSYQANIPTCAPVGSLPVSGVNAANMRQVPDVAFVASGVTDPYVTIWEICSVDPNTMDCNATGGDPSLQPGGGTSYAAPSFAGVVSLMDQVAGGRLGNINPLLYALNTAVPAAFHDVATGNNEITCTAGSASYPGCSAGGLYGYPATTGYDCGTGLGSLDVYKLLTAMGSLVPTATALVAAPTSTTETTPVALTATVTLGGGATSSQSFAGGVVTFAFESTDASGNPDLNWGTWTVGTGTLAGTAAAGTATLTTTIPPGLVKPGMQSVSVYAEYGGDAYHFPSVSPAVTINFAPLTLAIAPVNPDVAPSGTLQFSAMGGVTPMKWYTGSDTTCSMTTFVCSSINETTGAFTAGPMAGQTQVIGMDADGAYAMTVVNVGTSTDGGMTMTDAGMTTDGGTVVDAGGGDSATSTDSGPAVDSGKPADGGSSSDANGPAPGSDSGIESDAGADAAPGGGSGSSGGCGCKTAGVPVSDAGALGLGGFLLIGLTLRRRRAR
jgi:subtilase family serine protease